MWCHGFGYGGFGFGMFNGFGSIFGVVLTVLAVLFAVKLVKDIFFGNIGKKEETSKI